MTQPATLEETQLPPTLRATTQHPPRALASHAALALFTLLLAVLTLHLVQVLQTWLQSVRYPFGLDYGEGIVWQQAALIPGARMYGDIHHYPYIVFHYPPVYHLTVRAIASLGSDWLLAGRAVSLTATLATGALIAALTTHAVRTTATRTTTVIAATVAALITFTYIPVVICAPLMRVDMLAVAWSFLGVYCAVRSLDRPWLLYLAVAIFVLAVYTKQTAIAAPLAALPIVFLLHPRRTALASCVGLVLATAALALLEWQTDGGFLRHILLYNINRYSFPIAILTILQQASHAIYLFLAIAGIIIAWQSLLRASSTHPTHTPSIRHSSPAKTFAAMRADLLRNPSACIPVIFTLYFAVTTAMLTAAGKSGATVNYFIEWMCVWSVLIGVLIASVLTTATDRPLPALCVAAALLVQVLILPTSHQRQWADPAKLPELQALLERVRTADKPVISDDMVLLMKAGKPMPWEPAIFAELATTGTWDQTPFIAMITARQFAFIITLGQHGDTIYDSRYTPEVNAAIEAAYPRTEQQAGLVVHLPPG
jgi:hypothetical protein